MNVAFLGNLTSALPLLRAVTSSERHQLAPSHLSGPLEEAVSQAGLAVPRTTTEEDVVLGREAALVVVAEATAARSLELCRTAAQADVPLIVFPPNDASSAWAFELHLIHDESQRGILPVTGRTYLTTAAITPPPGEIRQIRGIARLTDNAATPFAEIRTLVDVLLASGFPYSRVTAVELKASDEVLLSHSLTLGSSAVSELALPPAVLTFESNEATADSELGRIEFTGTSAGELTVELRPENSASIDLQSLTDRQADRDECSRALEAMGIVLEVEGAIRKSLRRSRTVDVHFDSGSERGAFKTQMATIGCGVLLFTLMALIAYLIVGELAEPPNWVMHTLRVLWIAPLVLFLLAQLLLPLARERGSTTAVSNKPQQAEKN